MKTKTEIEADKQFILDLFNKFKAVSPDTQQTVLKMLSDLIDEKDDEKSITFYTDLLNCLADNAKEKTDEN